MWGATSLNEYTVAVPTAVPTPTVDFANVVFAATGEDAQFKDYIKTLLALNITTGVKDANGKIYFFGDNSVTRGQVATFLFRAKGLAAKDVSAADVNNSFSDSKIINSMLQSHG